ncbi:MAG: SusC/RagA family TonB-linked outer membrane protein [Mangrovibacterium sp.]
MKDKITQKYALWERMQKVIVSMFLLIACCIGVSQEAVANGNGENVSDALAQQGKVIKGKVVDEKKIPLPGVTVVVKGTTNGAVTDIDGNYSLGNVPAGAVLHFSFIGMTPQDVPVNGHPTIDIQMKAENIGLDEVVAVGFGTQKKVNLTGSVGIATAKDIQSRPVTNATQALQGMVPGLQLSTSDGALDKSMSISIRGEGTIGEGSSASPLILIDGMEGDLNTINPEDIDNISVLKDAAASSIYGSRAPFGVILVTTKRGKKGKTRVNYNNSFRLSSPINLPKQMDSYTFANYFNQAASNAGQGAVFSASVMQQMLDFQAAGGTSTGGLPTDGNLWGKPAGDPFTTAYANTDWYGELYKENSFSQEHNVSINGGTEKTSYYASLGFLNQNGLLNFGDDGLDRYNISAKINTELASWLDFNFSTRFIRTDNWRPTSYNEGSFYEKVGRQTWPNLPIYDENGYFHNSNAQTPAMSLAEGGNRNVITDQMYYQGALVIKPMTNWDTHIEFNYSTSNQNVKETSLPTYNHDVAGNIVDTNGTSSIYQDDQKDNYTNINIYSNYTFTLNDKHNFKLMGGFQSELFDRTFMSAKAYGLLIEDMDQIDLTDGLDGAGNLLNPEVSGNEGQWATAGFFGRINYNYDGKYLAEVNMRYDGSSRFREGDRWGFFPSVSLGWNIAREEFWESLSDKVGTLKLRASYGQLGNQNTSSWYPTYRTMTVNSNYGTWLQDGGKTNTSWVNALVSNTLTWETVSSWNIGLDWGAFDNRFTGSLDVYTRSTNNMVGPAPQLPSILGIAQPNTNNTDLKTSGWELSAHWNDELKNGISYGVSFMLSDAQTTITRYPGNPTNSISNYYEGGKIGDIWGYETVGIAKTQDEMNKHLEAVGGQSALGSEWGAGDIMYADLDGNPGITKGEETVQNPGDMKIIGNDTPRYQFGLDLNASWKGFDIRAFFQGTMKRDVWLSDNMFWGVYGSQWWSTGLAEHNDYFREDLVGLNGHMIDANTDSYYPRPIFDTNKNQQTQTRYLQHASYIRLKNLQFGYTFPSSMMERVGISKLRLYVSGENLWTGTKLSKLYDPETLSNHYPLSRTWSMGLNVTF